MSNVPPNHSESAVAEDAAVMLNLGCGTRFHPAWRNLDFAALVDGVQVQDLRDPLPYADGSVDACYTSHVLGHLKDGEAEYFLGEQRRVLKPGGVARFAVPDLAQVANNYLEILEGLLAGDRSREADYDWMLIELYDQVARGEPGGRMARYFEAGAVANPDFVVERIGEEGRALMESGYDGGERPSLVTRLRRGNFGRLVQKARLKVAGIAAGVIAGSRAKIAFEEGAFRNFSGEVQWRVYDAFSLGRALEAAGFVNPRVRTATDSAIPAFASYDFDTDSSEGERKPESLYLEAEAPTR